MYIYHNTSPDELSGYLTSVLKTKPEARKTPLMTVYMPDEQSIKIPDPELNQNPAYYINYGPRSLRNVIDGAVSSLEKLRDNVYNTREDETVARAIYRCDGIDGLTRKVAGSCLRNMFLVGQDEMTDELKKQSLRAITQHGDWLKQKTASEQPVNSVIITTPWRGDLHKSGRTIFELNSQRLGKRFKVAHDVWLDEKGDPELEVVTAERNKRRVNLVSPLSCKALENVGRVLNGGKVENISILTDTIQGGLELNKTIYGVLGALTQFKVRGRMGLYVDTCYSMEDAFLEPTVGTILNKVRTLSSNDHIDLEFHPGINTPTWEAMDLGGLNVLKNGLISKLQFPHAIAGALSSVGASNLPCKAFPNPPMVDSGVDNSLLLKDRIGREI